MTAMVMVVTTTNVATTTIAEVPPAAACIEISSDPFTGAVSAFTLSLSTTAAPVCGDGIVDAPEICDDQNATDGDGCSACELDFGFLCDVTVTPSLCTALPDLGSFAATEVIPTLEGGAIEAGDHDLYTITFTEDVLLLGTLDGWATGDADFMIFSDFNEIPFSSGSTIPETTNTAGYPSR